MTDYFKCRNSYEIASFLRRLAVTVQQRTQMKSLAAQMLFHWMNGGGQKKVFSAEYLRNLPFINQYLLREIRPVFLTQKKALLIGRRRIWGWNCRETQRHCSCRRAAAIARRKMANQLRRSEPHDAKD